MNLRDCVCEIQYRILIKTTLLEKETIHYSTTILFHKFIPMPQAMKIPAGKAAVDKEWEKLEKISAWNLTIVIGKKEVIDIPLPAAGGGGVFAVLAKAVASLDLETHGGEVIVLFADGSSVVAHPSDSCTRLYLSRTFPTSRTSWMVSPKL